MLVEQIGPTGHALHRQRFVGGGSECRVGRDLACDTVVDDEHVAPQHALLTLLEDGRVRVQDLGTRNGTWVEGKRIPAEGVVVAQGDILIGSTRLRVRTLHTPVVQERAFRREFVRRHRTPLAVAGVAACVAYAAFFRWLDAPASLNRSITTAVLATLVLLALWTGVWALTTKLNQGVWQVRVHLTIASIAAALCAWGYWAAGLVAFSAQWSMLAEVGVAVVGMSAFVAVYLHLREATRYGRRVSLALAGAAAVVITAIAWVAAIGLVESNVNSVDLGPEVRLGADRIVPNRDIADYLTEVDKLKREASRQRQRSLLDAPLADAEGED
jgi:hypothetical protein